MKITPRPGIFTDEPLLDAEPFWHHSSNVRFRFGVPQTIGLYSRIIDSATGLPVTFPLGGATADLYSDGDVLLVGHDNKLSLLHWRDGDIRTTAIAGLASGGRWWFDATVEAVFFSRAEPGAPVIALDRETLLTQVVANTPPGSVAGGVYAGVLILAGTTSIDGSYNKMLVRWSARRTDAPNGGGFVGFEDWTPSDINASGEIELENGSAVIGGGTTPFGFMVWTDTALYQITARTDIYVFAEKQVSSRGLLGSQCWHVADDKLWWIDRTRTLNVYDGGRAYQIVCSMRQASIEALMDADVDRCSMSSNVEHGEISFHYPVGDRMFELIYNYREQVWYPFDLDRLTMTSPSDPRPSIGIDTLGQLYYFDLRELNAVMLEYLDGQPDPPADMDPFQASDVPEPFNCFLQTNTVTAGNAAIQSMRNRNAVLSMAVAKVRGTPAINDEITLTVDSYGMLDLNEAPTTDSHTNKIGAMEFPLRAGGKALQFKISAENIQTFVRFGPIDVEADGAGKR